MRNRLTVILAAATLALVVTSYYPATERTQSASKHPGNSLVDEVPSGHWAYPALSRLQQGELASRSLLPGPNGKKPVTRFEMAVLLSRMIEKLDDASTNAKLPWDKLELLDKLYKEFRGDINNLGADMGNMRSRLDQLAKKLEEEGQNGNMNGKLVKQVFDATQKVDAMASSVKKQDQRLRSISAKLKNQNKSFGETQEKLKVFSEVLAKVLVKMARLEKDSTEKEAPQVAGFSRKNLKQLKGLLKEFAISFERRLANIETHTGIGIPAQTRMPVPQAPRRSPAPRKPAEEYPMPSPDEM